MSAHSSNFIRLRLYFDYPPPAAVGCRMCWMLVDLNACRVVADLESIIREKFEFSRRSILSLFVEDCYLPHTESIYVVRDNDNVRVKVDCLAQVNVHSNLTDAASVNCRKRQRDTGEDGLGNNGVRVEWKKKKKKKQCEEIPPEDAKQAAVEKSKKSKRKKRTEKRDERTVDNSHPVTPKPAAAPQKIQRYVDPPIKSTKKPSEAQVKTNNAISSDSSSSSSDGDEAPKETAAKASSTPAASKAPSNSKPTQKKSHPPSSPSSETDSSSDTAFSAKISPKVKPLPPTTNSKSHQALSVVQSTNCAQKQAVSLPCDGMMEPQDPGSDEEIQLVIRRPQAPGRSTASHSHWPGRCRGAERHAGGPGEYGSAEGCFESNCNGAQELSYKTDSLTNMSVVLQNGAESVPKQDYSSMPLLAAPPQVGQKIAFKLLELTENYTPEISEYKEGRIVSFDPNTKQIELQLINTSQAPVEPGKFDLVYQNPDGSERVEYAVSRGSWVTERWESLLEPRLII
ncbi:coilin [Odontesthes bonariensis]|uniref:coilin n=1 Tax=Odontesthes bonariensis TaxID=219752 RepID=UPI003F589476